MTVIDVVCVAFGVLGWAYCVKLYRELHKWARQCQRARIAVAYKRRVQLQAPLVEWLQWCNALDKDEQSSGRVVYRNGGVTVAILKAIKPARRGRKNQSAPQTGKWTATDQTKHAK